jgi:hypothetical protein
LVEAEVRRLAECERLRIGPHFNTGGAPHLVSDIRTAGLGPSHRTSSSATTLAF